MESGREIQQIDGFSTRRTSQDDFYNNLDAIVASVEHLVNGDAFDVAEFHRRVEDVLYAFRTLCQKNELRKYPTGLHQLWAYIGLPIEQVSQDLGVSVDLLDRRMEEALLSWPLYSDGDRLLLVVQFARVDRLLANDSSDDTDSVGDTDTTFSVDGSSSSESDAAVGGGSVSGGSGDDGVPGSFVDGVAVVGEGSVRGGYSGSSSDVPGSSVDADSDGVAGGSVSGGSGDDGVVPGSLVDAVAVGRGGSVRGGSDTDSTFSVNSGSSSDVPGSSVDADSDGVAGGSVRVPGSFVDGVAVGVGGSVGGGFDGDDDDGDDDGEDVVGINGVGFRIVQRVFYRVPRAYSLDEIHDYLRLRLMEDALDPYILTELHYEIHGTRFGPVETEEQWMYVLNHPDNHFKVNVLFVQTN